MAWYLLLEYTIWGRRGSSESFGKTPELPSGFREIPQSVVGCVVRLVGNHEATTPECHTNLPHAHGHFFSAPPLMAVSVCSPRSLCVSLSGTTKVAQLP